MVEKIEITKKITKDKLPEFVFNLAVQFNNVEATELAPIVIKVIEKITEPQLSFSELSGEQQEIIIDFITEFLPQLILEDAAKA
ncbi:MAG: hypothetical protein COU63_02075 [Candidatus Pacebacteria bacterium CG10_big_fil_rev_8_21_14_0_10_36_11]|nr:hypothetical protein [Candidatus Pacearchaeota archaeon]OIP73635.1 MAG: hypothetical protein AUK08_03650 [Candidatus Pacebacteria bacterium CG2_30_36_39]PIR64783.1 MAG: hypothetical protein COU63_02075 [Candidatus Pacebacteria bacterium CG10_big_fil_rev_8_21_14_0_10_36_11]PJC43140.1 MAG: hypothetical protein CO040_00780 [Candidatus Pacebacteria bacterium CG_4_9_14_0_2_um_filter_36_8]